MIPIPAAVFPGRYEISEVVNGQGYCAPAADGQGLFGVPFGLLPSELSIRVHEYRHLALAKSGRFGSQTLEFLLAKGLEPGWAQVGLDLLVNFGCKEIQDLPFPTINRESVKALPRPLQGQLRLQSLPLRRVSPFLAYADEKFLKFKESEILDSSDRNQLAEALLSVQSYFSIGRREGGEEIKNEKFLSLPWGTMKIIDPPKQNFHCVRSLRQIRPGVIGSPRFLFRMSTDLKICGLRKRVPGISLLIDCSASMQIKSWQIEQILKTAPASTIAGYSGRYNDGDLVILAKDGKYCFFDAWEHGNVIDVPALEWLAKQPNPRVWICDGEVTGIGDRYSRTTFQMCEKIQKEAKIERIASLFEFLDSLERVKSR